MRLVRQDQRYLLKDSNSLAFYNLPTGTVRAGARWVGWIAF